MILCHSQSMKNIRTFTVLRTLIRRAVICLFFLWHSKMPPGHIWNGPRPQYHLHFIIDGKGTLQVNDTTYHLKRRQLFLCPPDTPLRYNADSADPWHYAWVSFYGPKAVLWLKQAGFDQKHLIRESYVPIEQFTILIQKLLTTSKPTASNELKQLSCLFHLMSLLISSNITQKMLRASEAPNPMKLF